MVGSDIGYCYVDDEDEYYEDYEDGDETYQEKVYIYGLVQFLGWAKLRFRVFTKKDDIYLAYAIVYSQDDSDANPCMKYNDGPVNMLKELPNKQLPSALIPLNGDLLDLWSRDGAVLYYYIK